MEVKTTFEAREMASIMSHLEGPAKKEVQMYRKKDRSNPDFLLDVLTQAFGTIEWKSARNLVVINTLTHINYGQLHVRVVDITDEDV